MTYGEIEFLDGPVAPLDDHVPDEPSGAPLGVVAVVGWIAAAVLSVRAPFQALYRVGQPAVDDNPAFGLSIELDVRAALDSFTHIPAGDEPTQPAVHASYGPFLWLSLAALACAIAATTAQVRSLRNPVRDEHR